MPSHRIIGHKWNSKLCATAYAESAGEGKAADFLKTNNLIP